MKDLKERKGHVKCLRNATLKSGTSPSFKSFRDTLKDSFLLWPHYQEECEKSGEAGSRRNTRRSPIRWSNQI